MDRFRKARQVSEDDMAIELAPLSRVATRQETVEPPQQRVEQWMESVVAMSGSEPSSHAFSRNKHRLRIVLVALYLSLFVATLDVTIFPPSIPVIMSSFKSAAEYAWVGSAYHFACGGFTPVWGAISSIWGHKAIMLVVVFAFAVGTAISGSAPAVGVLLLGRTIQGAAASGIVILVNLCISDLFGTSDRAFYYGLTGIVSALATAIGPVLGGVFSEYVSWRWTWWILLPGSGFAFIALAFCLNVQSPRFTFKEGMQSIDWFGIVTIVGMVVTLFLGLNLGGIFDPWGSSRVVCLLAFGCVAGFFFLYYESNYAKKEKALFSIHILRRHANKAAFLVGFTHGFINSACLYFLPLYFQSSRSLGPLHSGLLLLPITVLQAFLGCAVPAFIYHKGYYEPLIYLGMALSTVGYALLTILSEKSPIYLPIIFSLILGGGIGLAMQPPLIALQTSLEYMDVPTATALYGFIRSLSTGISIVIGTVIFQNVMQSRSASLPGDLAAQFGGNKAAASVTVIQTLDETQAGLVKGAYAQSLSRMWIVYSCISGFGLICSFVINGRKLDKEHMRDLMNKSDGGDEQ